MNLNNIKNTQDQPIQRPIRSFVRRQGRITEGQKRSLELSPYLLRTLPEQHINLNDLFKRNNQYRTLEIGFGNGTSLAEMAAQAPERDFLGVEVHSPGVGHLLMEIEQRQLQNLHAICHDAVVLIDQHFAAASFDSVQIFFPDPWHKSRHNKRRLVQVAFINKLLPLLKPQGKIHLATDWQPYAEHMLETLNSIPELKNNYDHYAPRPDYRPLTKFELRGERLGHGVWDLIFSKV